MIVLAAVWCSAVLDSRFVTAANTNTIGLDDPELVIDPLFRQHPHDPAQHLEHELSTGNRRAQDNDAYVFVRRIGSDVGEVKVEREEHSRLGLAHFTHPRVLAAAQSFVQNRSARPARCAEKLDSLDRQVLIELRPHARILRREWQDPLLR